MDFNLQRFTTSIDVPKKFDEVTMQIKFITQNWGEANDIVNAVSSVLVTNGINDGTNLIGWHVTHRDVPATVV